MKTAERFMKAIVLSFTMGVVGSTFANAQASSDLRLQGRCVLTDQGHEAVWFDIKLGEQVEPLKFIEIDSFGNEIVTKVKLFFRFDDILAASFRTDLPAPLNGQATVTNPAPGSRLSALFPTRLGKQLDCNATVVNTAL